MAGDLIAAVVWMVMGAVLYRALRAQLAAEQRERHDARHLARQEEGRRAIGRTVDLSQAADHDPEWEWYQRHDGWVE